MSEWTKIMNAEELNTHYAEVADIDPAFSHRQHAFYEAQSANRLDALAAQAWECNESTSYMLARSHRAQITA